MNWIVWDKFPTYEEWCAKLGEDPTDERNYENYCEWATEFREDFRS